jgi:hypothetical protein
MSVTSLTGLKRTCQIVRQRMVQFYLVGEWVHTDLKISDVDDWCQANHLAYTLCGAGNATGEEVDWLDAKYPSVFMFEREEDAVLCHLTFV